MTAGGERNQAASSSHVARVKRIDVIAVNSIGLRNDSN
jgi:hypothetical protein